MFCLPILVLLPECRTSRTQSAIVTSTKVLLILNKITLIVKIFTNILQPLSMSCAPSIMKFPARLLQYQSKVSSRGAS